MKLRVQEKIQAVALRMEGYSYKEIMEQLPVSKSTLSGWLKHIKLTSEQEARLFSKIALRSNMGRAKGAITNRRKRVERQENAYMEAKEIFDRFQNDPFFAFGIALYWAEGSKKGEIFQFMNSDPEIILLMTLWLEKYSGFDRSRNIFYRLYIYHVYAHENCEAFWMQHLGILHTQMKKTIYKPTVHLVKRNPIYKGCMRIEISGIRYFWYVQLWQKLMANKIKIG